VSEERTGSATVESAPTTSRTSNVLAIVGWIAAVLFWPAGIVIGGVLASQDDKRGRWIIGVAVAIAVVWIVTFLVIMNAADDHATRSYYYE
jgi:hypothetical protein